MEMLAQRPVVNISWQGDDQGRGRFDLATGERIEGVSEAEALDVARVYLERHSIDGEPSLKLLTDRPDEFTVQSYLNPHRPLYQIRLNDPEQTLLYVSSTSGEVQQRTTASLRLWTWLGAIPHWLYFTELRRNGALWGQVIIWTSLAGCFLTVLGLFVGIRQFRRRHSTGNLSSPYRGPKFWHHMLGLVFGVLVLTWTFSGFTSIQPWGWLESGPKAGEAVDRLRGEPPTWADLRPALQAQTAAITLSGREVSQVSFSQSRTDSAFIWRLADGTRERIGPAGTPAPFDDAAQKRAGELLAGEGVEHRIDLMTTGDAYYYPGASSSDMPVLRIWAPALEDTRFYLDPLSGDVRFVADPGARDFRWWHMLLHRIDFVGSPIREIIVVLLMLGVSAVCGFGAWIGIRKLARGGKLDNQPPDIA
jgi:hypothetical protein